MNARVLFGAATGLVSGIVVVSVTANVVTAAQPVPTFSTKSKRFDNTHFSGRFSQMLNSMDPSTLLATDAQIREAQRKVTSPTRQGTDAELWAAQKLVDSAIHPDTNEILPRPFRMAGYVPFNGPVCVSMMVVTSTPAMLFWGWVNQSQNAAVNYFNRNASSPMPTELLMKSYATAVGCALFIAFGVSQGIQKRFSPARAQQLLKFVALPSSMVASSANAYIMRSPEIDTGISVYDAPVAGKLVGEGSKVAATKAVQETALSRVLLQLPTFFLPPVFMMIPPIAAAAMASPALGLAANTFITVVGFGLGLPAAVAYFPQIGEIQVKDMEEGPAKKTAESRGLKSVFYNKGL